MRTGRSPVNAASLAQNRHRRPVCFPRALPLARNRCCRVMATQAGGATQQQQQQQAERQRVRLVLVGDVHGQWSGDDEAALAALAPDFAVFVGDFGEEDVELVRRVKRCPSPKCVMLGNHDAWFSLTGAGRARYARSVGAALAAGRGLGGNGSGRVRQQLDILGSEHIGYGEAAVPGKDASVVGARPFSKGGDCWKDVRPFYEEHYRVGSSQQSAKRIADALQRQPRHPHATIVVGHNGPAGLGGRHHSICGADFKPEAGDHGDGDLRDALDRAAARGAPPALVVFGHMHEVLKHGGEGGRTRDMVVIEAERGTVYLNCAVVPRVRDAAWLDTASTSGAADANAGPGPSSSSAGAAGGSGSPRGSPRGRRRSNGSGGGGGKRPFPGSAGTAGSGGSGKGRTHHFTTVDLEGGHVVRAANVYVLVPPGYGAAAAAAATAAAPAAKRAAAVGSDTGPSAAATAATTPTTKTSAGTAAAVGTAAAAAAGSGDAQPRVALEQVLLKRVSSDDPGSTLVRTIYSGHSMRWHEVASPLHPHTHTEGGGDGDGDGSGKAPVEEEPAAAQPVGVP